MSSHLSGPGTPSSSASTPTGSSTPITSSHLPPTTTATTPGTPGPKRRKNAAAHASLPKPKKPKLHRNLDSITARKELPNVPAAGGIGKSGQRMVKGPYKKREKKEKPDGGGKKGAASGGGAGAGGPSGTTGKGGRKAGAAQGSKGDAGASSLSSSSAHGPVQQEGGATGAENDARVDGSGEGGDDDNDGKDDDDDDHEEEPEYSEFEWNQEANSRGRSKDELKALLDCFSEDQLKRYEVYRRSGLNRPTVKKLVGTILNQQVTQTMTFVVAGFCKVYVGEMVEKAREVMDDWNETGPIRPEHLREAQRRSKQEEVQKGRGVQTPHGYKRRMFCR
ncbi:transcription initiation factor TFIID subunit 11 [Podila verticillata]|nr:transcription initiation factor TFIID subunit 11 [Podila verticillata]